MWCSNRPSALFGARACKARLYLIHMARGWESKSIEAQQAEASQGEKPSRRRLSAQETELVRKRETLLLQRKLLLQQLQQVSNDRHRAMLEAGLAHVDEQLEILRPQLSEDV